MGRGRPKKRSLTPASESLTLPVGAEAELRSDVPAFLGSFYEVTITGHLVSSGRYKVVYSKLMADDGGRLQVTSAAADVRPRPPPSARRGFAVHDTVEALHKKGWWAGVVSSIPRPGVCEVAFPTSRQTIEFEETALRPHRVFQAGRWVPAAELDVLGSGISKKYAVKLKTYETAMDDVECLDRLIVQETHLRPKFRWDGTKWLRCLKEKSANVPTLASRKRPIPSALSVRKEVGETSDEHGSYREKKLKKAAVASEPILLSYLYL